MGTNIVRETKHYDDFEPHEYNRNVERIRTLEASMRKYGWWPHSPMAVFKNGNGKYKIIDGHHRFYVARKLGIPVKFMETDKRITMREIEDTINKWTLKDYMVSYVSQDKPAYEKVRTFQQYSGLPVNICATLMSGQTAVNAHNFTRSFKDGDYHIGNTTYAYIVADIVRQCKEKGFTFATNKMFVGALARIVRVKGFDKDLLRHKIDSFPFLLTRQPTIQTYEKVIEDLYNYKTPVAKKMPLAFLADEAAKDRNPAKKRNAA